MEAAVKSADASNSFSPCTLLNRTLERIHISRGMLKMRISVMELGRFTRVGWFRRPPESSFDYAPRGRGTQCVKSMTSHSEGLTTEDTEDAENLLMCPLVAPPSRRLS